MPSHIHAMPHTSTHWAWRGAGLGVLLALVTQAPAHWLAHTAETLSGERLLWQDPQGTVWHGSAQWVLNEGRRDNTRPAGTTRALPTRVTWDISPRIDWQQMRLSLRTTLTSDCCTPQPVEVNISPVWLGVRVQLSDHTSQWPADWLVGLGAPWNTVQPQGRLQLHTSQLQLIHQAGQSQLQGQAELHMQQLSTRLSTLRPLGSYRVRVQGGDVPALTLDTLEGSLLLQGSGQLVQGRVQFNGEATAAPDAQAALSNLLNILGQRQGDKSILKIG